jgi:hypothetical protein
MVTTFTVFQLHLHFDANQLLRHLTSNISCIMRHFFRIRSKKCLVTIKLERFCRTHFALKLKNFPKQDITNNHLEILSIKIPQKHQVTE